MLFPTFRFDIAKESVFDIRIKHQKFCSQLIIGLYFLNFFYSIINWEI